MQRILLSCFLLLLSSAPAFAGAVSGGGGKAVVCRNADRSIRSAELLDLWEAREIYGREILRSDHSFHDLVLEGIERMKTAFLIGNWMDENGEYLRMTLDNATIELRGDAPVYQNKMIRRLRGVTLNDTPDSFELARPNDCAVEQVVNFVDLAGLPQVYINQDLWEALDNVNQAALVLHEGLYRVLRERYGEDNSLRTRRAVGVVMSGQSFRSTFDMLRPAHTRCDSADGETTLHLVSFVPDWDQPFREPNAPMIGFYMERVLGLPTMGFTKFSTGVGPVGGYADIVNPSLPLRSRDRNHFDIDLPSDVEPELSATFDVDGPTGGKKTVSLLIKHRVAGAALPQKVELACYPMPEYKRPEPPK